MEPNLELIKAAKAALLALRSYQHGNSSTELAEEIVDALEAALKHPDIAPYVKDIAPFFK